MPSWSLQACSITEVSRHTVAVAFFRLFWVTHRLSLLFGLLGDVLDSVDRARSVQATSLDRHQPISGTPGTGTRGFPKERLRSCHEPLEAPSSFEVRRCFGTHVAGLDPCFFPTERGAVLWTKRSPNGHRATPANVTDRAGRKFRVLDLEDLMVGTSLCDCCRDPFTFRHPCFPIHLVTASPRDPKHQGETWLAPPGLCKLNDSTVP